MDPPYTLDISQDANTFIEPPEAPVPPHLFSVTTKKRPFAVLFENEEDPGVIDEPPSSKRIKMKEEANARCVLARFDHEIDEQTTEDYGYSISLRLADDENDADDAAVPDPLSHAEWSVADQYFKKHNIPFFSTPEKMNSAVIKLAQSHYIAVSYKTHLVSSVHFEAERKGDEEGWFVDICVEFSTARHRDCTKARLTLQMFDVSEETWNSILTSC